MDFPLPLPGQVIRYSYLWASEHDAGQVEGSKDRPVAVTLVTQTTAGKATVLVLPITHTPPVQPQDAIEIPAETKRRLDLDDARSWVVVTEINVFTWPGPDLRPVPNTSPQSVTYGILPRGFFRAVRDRLIAHATAEGLRQVPRTT